MALIMSLRHDQVVLDGGDARGYELRSLVYLSFFLPSSFMRANYYLMMDKLSDK